MFLRITVLMFVKIEIDNFSFYLPYAEVFKDGFKNYHSLYNYKIIIYSIFLDIYKIKI